tara:strand:- start:3162 stop:3665 length:504 start_codon:yes stop_codon:yes gene_type:complete
MKNISIIVAVSSNQVIGKDNKLAWNLPYDMKYFSNITRNHTVIMGRKNWESIPEKFRPLPNRKNIIVSRNKKYKIKSSIVVNSVEKAIEVAKNDNDNEIFIIGGGEIYKASFKYINKLYITEIRSIIEGNTFFPKWNKKKWKEVSRISNKKDKVHKYDFDFVVYIKK